MDVEEKTRICNLVEAVLTADGVIQPAERDFMRRIAQRFQIPYDVLEAGPVSERTPVSDPGRASTLLRELPEDTRTRVMAILVESAVTEGEVHPSERALLLVASAALGIDATAVEERVQRRLEKVSRANAAS
ncbi:MAG TPA: hypothetical protein ENK57_22790 [Polyangiaceae bacterium]|nr:hypothetical protein [Polyangiaceae bacterium]